MLNVEVQEIGEIEHMENNTFERPEGINPIESAFPLHRPSTSRHQTVDATTVATRIRSLSPESRNFYEDIGIIPDGRGTENLFTLNHADFAFEIGA